MAESLPVLEHACPARDELARYALGQLPDDRFESIANHTSACGVCQKALETLDSQHDPLLERLRSVARSDIPAPVDDEQVRSLVEQMADLLAVDSKRPPQGDLKAEVDPLLGQILGSYQLVAHLGQGGMGTVYRARHLRLKREVAFKIVSSALRKPSAIARFEREMEAIGRAEHPNIVRAYDAGEIDGHLYLAMELLDGVDLSIASRRLGPLSVADACEIIRQAALGLEHANQQGLVHRDIKPSNLMLCRDGIVKVLDLGLALLRSELSNAEHVTHDGQVLGTLDYLAPEQAEDGHAVDIRADLYSLGCTLFRLLTGRAPFDSGGRASVVQILKSHATATPPLVRNSRPDAPADLEAILARLLAKKPSERFASPAELVLALIPLTTGCDLPQLAARAMTGTESLQRSEELDTSTSYTSSPTILPVLPPLEGAAPLVGVTPPRKNLRRLLAAGAGGFLALLLGVWVIVRDRDGNEVGRVEVPEGSVVVVQNDLAKTSTPISMPTTQPIIPPSPTDAPAMAVAPFNAAQARSHQEAWAKHLGTTVETTNSLGAKLILIPPGEFLMGSSKQDIAEALKSAETATGVSKAPFEQTAAEGPQHPVVLTRPYWIGQTEVTVGQFRKFARATGYKTVAETSDLLAKGWEPPNSGAEKGQEVDGKFTWENPGWEPSDDEPVVMIAWHDAVAFCNWLSQQEGLGQGYRTSFQGQIQRQPACYALPTEAEWEFACRAGTVTPWSCGKDSDIRKRENISTSNFKKPCEVQIGLPNPFGLLGMHGNVKELCNDLWRTNYSGTERMVDPIGLPDAGKFRHTLRGGSFKSQVWSCRSAARYAPSGNEPFNYSTGFRVAKLIDALATDEGAGSK